MRSRMRTLGAATVCLSIDDPTAEPGARRRVEIDMIARAAAAAEGGGGRTCLSD